MCRERKILLFLLKPLSVPLSQPPLLQPRTGASQLAGLGKESLLVSWPLKDSGCSPCKQWERKALPFPSCPLCCRLLAPSAANCSLGSNYLPGMGREGRLAEWSVYNGAWGNLPLVLSSVLLWNTRLPRAVFSSPFSLHFFFLKIPSSSAFCLGFLCVCSSPLHGVDRCSLSFPLSLCIVLKQIPLLTCSWVSSVLLLLFSLASFFISF